MSLILIGAGLYLLIGLIKAGLIIKERFDHGHDICVVDTFCFLLYIVLWLPFFLFERWHDIMNFVLLKGKGNS